MIEVLFGESEAGSMKAAKNTVIPGEAGEVVCLGFMLDIGDIREAVDSPYRKNLIYSMYAQEQWGKDPEAEAELKKAGDVYAGEEARLKTFLEHGESLRVWYSHAPYSRCGLYRLCSILQNIPNAIRVVRLPEYRLQENMIVSYRDWGEIAPEDFASFLTDERSLSKMEMRMHAAVWNELVEDNSPLRAVVNGRVIGVPEDFYDFLIWKNLTGEPIKQARLIGDILGHYPVSVGDWWYAKRIDHLISKGKIRVDRDSEKKYAREICLDQVR